MALLTDLRLALRTLLKTRGFALTAILTLALGMTLCVTAMVVTKAYLFQALPYPKSERLYWVRYGAPGQEQPRDMERLDWTSLSDVVEHQVAWDLDVFYLLGGDHAEAIQGAWVTPGFVAGLGIHPAFGPGFGRAAFAQGGSNEVLISHRFWLSRFGGDPNAIGRSFTAFVSDRPEEAERFTITGVLPQDFWHINTYTDIVAPLRAPTYPYMMRLQPGVTADAAAARITTLVTGGARDVPPNWRPQLIPTHAAYVQGLSQLLRPVTIAAALVLLVACANVAALLLVRATRRQKEMQVRRALGAGWAAIARVVLAEALIIGTSATITALWATRLIIHWLAPLIQQQIGRPAPGGVSAFSLDWKMLTFAAAAGLATTLLCGSVPLIQDLRGGRQRSLLHGAGRAATDGPRGQRLRSALIAMEIAVSLTLLVGGTLMVRSVIRLVQTDLGFDATPVISASITLRQSRYQDAASREAVFERMVSRLAAIPGVSTVGLTTAWPLQQPAQQTVETPASLSVRAGVQSVNDGYFASLSIDVVAGRAFQAADRAGAAPVAIVSETLARRLWPDGLGVGRRVIVPQARESGEPLRVERTVVGVVRDVRQLPSDQELGDLYLPILQPPGRFALALVRTSRDPAASLPAFRAAFRDIDPEISVTRAAPLQAGVDNLVARPRFLASLLSAFAIVAALLAVIGIYGVIAYAIKQREREIALRMALGADARRLTRQFIGQGSVLLAIGLGIGVTGALVAGRLIESQLFGVSPRDPVALGSAVTAFAIAGLAAIWWPARRAAVTNPAIALRAE